MKSNSIKQTSWESSYNKIIGPIYLEVDASVAEDLDVKLKEFIKSELTKAKEEAYQKGVREERERIEVLLGEALKGEKLSGMSLFKLKLLLSQPKDNKTHLTLAQKKVVGNTLRALSELSQPKE